MSVKFKNDITLKMVSDEIAQLCRNGEDMCCPYVPPTVYPNPSGGFNMIRTSCSTMCPLFEVKENGKKVQINCGSKVTHTISKIIPVIETIKKPSLTKTIFKKDNTVN